MLRSIFFNKKLILTYCVIALFLVLFIFFNKYNQTNTEYSYESQMNIVANNGSMNALVSTNLHAAQFYNGKTYITYSGTNFNPYIVSYDHQKKAWSKPIEVGTNPLIEDGHGAPALLVDNKGYIHIFYGSHASALLYVKSKSPEDINLWQKMKSPVEIGTYPQLIQMSDGKLNLFYRNGTTHIGDWMNIVSEDGGQLWSKPVVVLDGVKPIDAWYAMFVKGNNDTIHVAFVYKDEANSKKAINPEYYHRYNVYYIFRDLSGDWKNGFSQKVNLPLQKSDADKMALVYDSKSNHTQIPWLSIDNKNKPHILFLECENFVSAYCEYNYSKIIDGSWVTNKIGAFADNLFNFYALDIRQNNYLDAYLVVSDGERKIYREDRGGGIEKWSTIDGKTWFKKQVIASDKIFNDPQIVLNYNKEGKVVFSQWSDDPNNFNNKVFLFGDK